MAGAGGGGGGGEKVKLVCSLGGCLMPRPADGAVRHAGGDTRIVAFPRDLSLPLLLSKLAATFSLPSPVSFTFKYQLPGEPIDAALVSVTNGEDLENLLEEYDKLPANGKLRAFLFPYSLTGAAAGSGDRASELDGSDTSYIEAVNGIVRRDSFASLGSTHSDCPPLAAAATGSASPLLSPTSTASNDAFAQAAPLVDVDERPQPPPPNKLKERQRQPLSQLPPLQPAFLHDLGQGTPQLQRPQGGVLRMDECTLCFRALPHAHSDPITEYNEGHSGITPEPSPVFLSLRPEDAARWIPVERLVPVAVGPYGYQHIPAMQLSGQQAYASTMIYDPTSSKQLPPGCGYHHILVQSHERMNVHSHGTHVDNAANIQQDNGQQFPAAYGLPSHLSKQDVVPMNAHHLDAAAAMGKCVPLWNQQQLPATYNAPPSSNSSEATAASNCPPAAQWPSVLDFPQNPVKQEAVQPSDGFVGSAANSENSNSSALLDPPTSLQQNSQQPLLLQQSHLPSPVHQYPPKQHHDTMRGDGLVAPAPSVRADHTIQYQHVFPPQQQQLVMQQLPHGLSEYTTNQESLSSNSHFLAAATKQFDQASIQLSQQHTPADFGFSQTQPLQDAVSKHLIDGGVDMRAPEGWQLSGESAAVHGVNHVDTMDRLMNSLHIIPDMAGSGEHRKHAVPPDLDNSQLPDTSQPKLESALIRSHTTKTKHLPEAAIDLQDQNAAMPTESNPAALAATYFQSVQPTYSHQANALMCTSGQGNCYHAFGAMAAATPSVGVEPAYATCASNLSTFVPENHLLGIHEAPKVPATNTAQYRTNLEHLQELCYPNSQFKEEFHCDELTIPTVIPGTDSMRVLGDVTFPPSNKTVYSVTGEHFQELVVKNSGLKEGDCRDETVKNDHMPSVPINQSLANQQFVNDQWDLLTSVSAMPPLPKKITCKDSVSPRDLITNNYTPKGNVPNQSNFSDEVILHSQPDLYRQNNSETADNQSYGYVNLDQSSAGIEEASIAPAIQVSQPLTIPTASNNVQTAAHFPTTNNNEARQPADVLSVIGDASNKVDGETQHSEDIRSRPIDWISAGFPVAEDLGRLQIIKNCDLEELQELGSGTFGTVYHGKWRGSDVAIKRINDRCFAGKPSEQERMRSDFWNEASKLADLHHPNVVAFYGVVLDGPGGSIATVTEYMVNGSLRHALMSNVDSLDLRKRLIIAMDVAFGMEYLHSKNIVHFDLKSDNLLVNLRDPQRPICKVGDLGLSKVKCKTLISGGVRGTLPWMAPELLNGSSSLVCEKVDVFSFGIVLWELLTGQEPYADLHYGVIIGGIVSNTLRPPVPESCDLEWRLLMEHCWANEPSMRPTFTEVATRLRSMATSSSQRAQP